jgi:small subunit ribosomal protein S9
MEESMRYYEGIGRRKRASARVRIYPQPGDDLVFTVNGKDVKDFFPRFGDFQILTGPLEDAGLMGKVSVTVLVVRLGLARALVKYDEQLRGPLRNNGHLTRDPRIKERKKPGLKRARKAPTYTKR